jgi:subtilisin-like proprotein convertase family protein
MRRPRSSRRSVVSRIRQVGKRSHRVHSRTSRSRRTGRAGASRGGYWSCRLEPLEARFLLSVAPWAFLGDSQSRTAVFDFAFHGTPSVDQIDGGAIVSLEGDETWIATGDPVVPVRQSTILLPQGMEITSVDACYLDPGEVIASGVRLLAAPAAVPFGDGESLPQQSPTFVAASFREPEAVAYANHTICGYNVGTLRIFPVEYDALADTLIHHSGISVTVTVAPGEEAGALSASISEVDRQRVAALVDNPQALDEYTFSESAPAASAALPMAGEYEYVIITSAGLEQSFQPLASQKIDRGLSATIVTTETIYANYAGTETGDDADKIRSFIADAYANWGTRWVLLGGDREIVPKRGVYSKVTTLQNRQTVDIIETDLPTDMYYACLDGTWNRDGDNLWGESNGGPGGGDVDLLPEVYIGRAPVSNSLEAANFVFKTVHYETTLHANPTTAVWLGEQLDNETWGSYSSTAIRDQCLPEDWDLIERYDLAGGWSGADLRGDLNASPHLVNHLGHANETYNARLYNSSVAGLRNADPYFMYSQGCMSGSFDTHDLAIAEQHVVADYGAFGVVMNSRYGWYIPGGTPGASHHYAMQFWDAVFNEGQIHLGQANQDSKDDNLFRVGSTGVYRWIHFETNLFGDPETPFQIGEGLMSGGEIHGTIAEDVDGDSQLQPPDHALGGQTVFLDLNNNGLLDAGTVNVASSDVPVDLLDNTTVTSMLLLGGAAVRISDVNVTLDIAHSYDSDLEAFLVGPSGTRVELFTHVGQWGANFTGTTLDDEAGSSIADPAAVAPFSGTFRPEGLLSRFDGEDPHGIWTLQITDTMSWDTGTLNSWSLEISFEEPHAQTGPDGAYVFADLAQGLYRVRHELSPGWTHTNPVEGVHVLEVQQGAVCQGVDFLARETPPAIDLGEIDFLQIADVNLTVDDHWYCGRTTREGYLTIEALVQGLPDQVQVTLYDASLNELATSSVSEIGQRIDWSVDAGQTYYFSVTGDSSDVDLRLANLVHQDGATVVVYGTAGDDRFDFAAGQWHRVTINGVDYEFSSLTVTTFQFHGGGGDTAALAGSDGADTAVMHPSLATLTGPGFHAEVDGAAEITVTGQGGTDVAYLYDSVGDDGFVGTTTYARLYGDGFDNQAFAFRYAHGYSLRGGTDVAWLFDDPGGQDTFEAWPHQARLYGNGFYNRVKSFRYVHAYATGGGSDVAYFYDRPDGQDAFEAWPHMARLYGDGFYNRALSFRYVHAYATAGGSDVARFYDDPSGQDVFEAWPHQARLYGDGFYNRARSFRYVHAYATAGAGDVARLYDSAGDDVFVARPEESKLYGSGFYNRTVGFRYVHAYAGAGGYDRANLYDSAGDDHLDASGDTAALFSDDLSLWAHGFDWISAISSWGGSDTKHVESIDYVLQLQGPWVDL